MTNSRIEEVLRYYEEALSALEEAIDGMVEMDGERQRKQRKKLLTKVRKTIGLPPKRDSYAYHILRSRIINVLTARDAVQEVLEDKTQDVSEKLLYIVKQDRRLKKQAESIIKAVNLKDLRASFNPPAHAWWWFIEQRFGLSSLLSIVFLVLSLSLIGDIAPRFLTGGPRLWENMVVILQGILVLITGSSIFSKTAGRKLANLFSDPGGKSLALALFLLAFSLILYQSLPQIAVCYRERGLSDFKNNRFDSAQSNYKLALALNPDDEKTHLYLGSMYDHLQDYQSARTEYRIAMMSRSATAFNNMARLDILKESYATAFSFLMESQALITAQDDMTLHYNFHKNLGWFYLKQKRLADAENELLLAIEGEDSDKPEELRSEDRGAAYCLLAQVLDAKGDTDQAIPKWENCLRYANPLLPEEAAWLEVAHERIDSQ